MTASVTCRFIVWFVFREALAGDKGASCDPAGLGWLQRQAPLQIQLHLQWTGWEWVIKSIQKCSHKPFCSLLHWSGTSHSSSWIYCISMVHFFFSSMFRDVSPSATRLPWRPSSSLSLLATRSWAARPSNYWRSSMTTRWRTAPFSFTYSATVASCCTATL